MRYAVQVLYLKGREGKEHLLPEGWEPIGGDIEDGNALRLVLMRQLSKEEEAAVPAEKPKRTRTKK